MIFLTYYWGCLFGVPVRVPVSNPSQRREWNSRNYPMNSWGKDSPQRRTIRIAQLFHVLTGMSSARRYCPRAILLEPYPRAPSIELYPLWSDSETPDRPPGRAGPRIPRSPRSPAAAADAPAAKPLRDEGSRPWADPESRSHNSGVTYSYGVDYRTLTWMYLLDPPERSAQWKMHFKHF